MAAWEDLDNDVYGLTVCKLGAHSRAYLYRYKDAYEVRHRGAMAPVVGRTLNEVKADAESWLKEQGYEITEASHVVG